MRCEFSEMERRNVREERNVDHGSIFIRSEWVFGVFRIGDR